MPTPSSKVWLLTDVNLLPDYEHTMTFSSTTTQFSFFLSKLKTGCAFTDLSYQRKESYFRVPKNADVLQDVTYLMFSNEQFTNKVYYAFVTNIEYVNPNTSFVYFEIDVMQTWGLPVFNDGDITLKECFVEREHVADDTPRNNLVPENLATGELVTTGANDGVEELTSLSYIVAVSEHYTFEINPQGGGEWLPVVGNVYGKIFQGTVFYAFDFDEANTTMKDFLDRYGGDKSTSVHCIFLIPSHFIGTTFSKDVVEPQYKIITANQNIIPIYKSYDAPYWDDIVLDNKDSLDGYIPKNNKLYTFPYTYLEIVNYQGGTGIYPYEYFNVGSEVQFQLTCPVSFQPSVRLAPINFKNQAVKYDESMTLSDYPVASWSTDGYKFWEQPNILNTIAGVTIGTAEAAFAVKSKQPAIGVAGVTRVATTIGDQISQAFKPNVLRGELVSGSNNFSTGIQNFGIRRKTLRYEQAQVIDDYFQRFGYKVARVKIPELNSRPYFNYVKADDVVLDGNVSADVKQQLISILKEGITFWHDEYIGIYDRDNSPT